MAKPTQKSLKESFRYSDGNLYRLKTTKKRPDTLGNKLGGLTGTGYIQGWFEGRLYYLHHLIWIYHNGYMPEGFLDHIDGDRTNNTIENLREVTPQQNAFNTSSQKDSSSRYKGVSWDKPRGKWRAKIVVDGEERFLGRFPSEKLAHEAYQEAANILQGEFKRDEKTN